MDFRQYNNANEKSICRKYKLDPDYMKFIKYISVVCSLLILFSCKRTGIKGEIEKFEAAPVILPFDSRIKASLFEGKQCQIRKSVSNYILVDYIDSTMCTECAITHLEDWVPLQKKIAEMGMSMSFVFIITPPKHMRNNIKEILSQKTDMDSFIYIDYMGYLEKKNPHFPKSKNLHTFILDEKGNVLLVGNPLTNDKIEGLMFEIINERSTNNT